MKKRKIFAVVMAAVMTLSLVACGEPTGNEVTPTTAPTATTTPTQAPVVDPEPTTAPAVVDEISVDFEDGNYGFAMVRTKPRKADLSNISLVDYNGSKALFVENQGGTEMHLGIDVDAILGDKVTEVRKITMTVGEQHPDGKFAAMSGYLAVFTGENLEETQLETWAVYMAKKNPKTVTFTLPEGTAFTAGNDNYITLVKNDDAGAALGSFYIDDIRFYDAAGNVLKGDTTVVMEAPNGFLAAVEEDEEPSANVVKVAGDAAYVGDWCQSAVVPNDVLAQFAGKDVNVKVKFELTNDKDYYIWAPMDGAWGKLGTQVVLPAEAEGKYHAQEDGTIALDDWSITEIKLTLPAALVDTMLATGDGTFFGMVYGVTAYEVVLEAEGATVIKEKIAGDDSYKGDWAQSAVVPADVLAKFAGLDVDVTVKIELTNDKDYYIWAPMDGSWGKLGTQVVLPAEAEGKYHAQEDGTIALDDWTIGEIKLTLPAALVDTMIATGDGTFFGMVYGVTAYEVVLEAEAAAAEPVKEKVAGDDSYVGDWCQSAVVPADVFAKFAGMDVKVTVKYELTNDKDYYIWAPMDGSWGKLGTQVILPAEAEGLYHAQEDGTIAIDDRTIEALTFTIPAALVDTMIATGDGTFFGMVYGVVAYEIVLEGTPAASAPAVDTPAVEEPAEPTVDARTETIEGTVIHSGSLTMADSSWWTQKDLTYADVFGTLDPATVAGVKFTSDTTFVLGYSNADTGAWDQYQDAKIGDTYVVKNMVLDKAEGESVCIICLSKGDGVEYTINWEVYGKDGDAAAEGVTGNFKGSYVGDYSAEWIPASAFEGCDNGAVVTLGVSKAGEAEGRTNQWWNITMIKSDWSKYLDAKYYIGEVPAFSQYEFVDVPGDTFTFTLSAEAVAQVKKDGQFGLQTDGIIFHTYTVAPVK